MSTATRSTGVYGEKIAQSYLQQKGFRLKVCNWRCGRLGEIDLVVYHPEHKLLAFVEVKTRRSTSAGSPLEAVTPVKAQRIIQMAQAYLAASPLEEGMVVRFDVVGVTLGGLRTPAVITHLENAFQAD